MASEQTVKTVLIPINMGERIRYRKLYVLPTRGRSHQFSLPLKESIRIGKRDYPIQLKNDERFGTYVLWKNRKYPVEVVRSGQNSYEILFNDITYNFTVETPFSYRRRRTLTKAIQSPLSGEIKAPMPGKITEVLVKEGDTISSGDTIAVLEAMKMENEIISAISGTIARLYVKQGSTVMKDDPIAAVVSD